MNFSFLRRSPSLGRPPLHRLVAAPGATAAEAVLRHLLAELPELLMAAVVATASGRVLASYTSHEQLRPGSAAPFWVAAVQQVQAQQAASAEQPTELLTTLPTQLHLLRVQTGGRHVLGLVVEAHDTNLALAREVVRQAMHELATNEQ